MNMSEESMETQQVESNDSDPITLAAQIAVAEGLAPEDSDGLGTLHFLNK
jgi:hypothetical protein